MTLPFTVEQFFEVFRAYNTGVWPAQWGLLIVGLAAVVLAWQGRERASAAAAGGLALLWLWMALVYHLRYFSTVNPAARAFAGVFLLQAGVFFWLGPVRHRLRFARPAGARGVAAAAFLLFAIVGYPLLGLLAGHRYPAFPTFGVPCPTTIFTLGLLGLHEPPFPRFVLAIPVAWAAVGGTAAWRLGVPQDYGLVAAGAFGVLLATLPQEERE